MYLIFFNFFKNVAKPFPMIRITPSEKQSAETSLPPLEVIY